MMNPKQTLRLEIQTLYFEWSKQGRTDEQKWAVMNFLTGTGLRINDLIDQESLRRSVADQKALLQRLDDKAIRCYPDLDGCSGCLMTLHIEYEILKLKTLEGQDEG